MTTVGYGDYYPITIGGRMIGFIISLWGVCVVSIMVVTISNMLMLHTSEEMALLLLRRLKFKENMRECAALVLTSAMRYRYLIRNFPDDENEHKVQLGRFKKYLVEFKQKKIQ